MWRVNLSVPLPVAALVSRYLTNKLIGHEPLPDRQVRRSPPLIAGSCGPAMSSSINHTFAKGLLPWLSSCPGYVVHALLTLSPLTIPKNGPYDLHVLAMPPAFVLSQDQTLQINLLEFSPKAAIWLWKEALHLAADENG